MELRIASSLKTWLNNESLHQLLLYKAYLEKGHAVTGCQLRANGAALRQTSADLVGNPDYPYLDAAVMQELRGRACVLLSARYGDGGLDARIGEIESTLAEVRRSIGAYQDEFNDSVKRGFVEPHLVAAKNTALTVAALAAAYFVDVLYSVAARSPNHLYEDLAKQVVRILKTGF